MGNKIEKENIEPLFFLKSGSVIIAPNQEIHLPQNYSEKYDWEVKIAAIISRQGCNITVDNALDIVASYTIFNDVSARDVGRRTDWPFGMDWFCYKSFDTSAPMGPWIIPAGDIADIQNLGLKTTINDDVKQDNNSNNMVFSVVELPISLSQQLTLKPGDIVATGTCTGGGSFQRIFLKPGDQITMEVEGIGTLVNPVVQGD